jgi:hypothetical protein
VRDFAPLSRYGPSTSASVGRCPRTHQQLCTGSDGADGAQSVRGNAGDRTSGTGGGGVARGSPVVGRGWPRDGHPPPERKTRVRRTGEAADGHTGEGRCVGRRVGAPVLPGGAADTPPSKVG